MKLLYAALASIVLALASGTALARNDRGGEGHGGSVARSGHMSAGQFGGSGHSFSGGQFARSNVGGHFGGSGPAFSGRQFAHGGGHFVNHGFHGGFHSGPGFGVIVGAPLFVDPYPYYYPPAYAAAPVLYCASAGAYYPDVPYCPEGWQRVPPPVVPY